MFSFYCAGLSDVHASIVLPTQPLFGISTPQDLYSWLAADEGLMTFLVSSSNTPLFSQAFPQLTKPDGRLIVLFFRRLDLSDTFSQRAELGVLTVPVCKLPSA